MVGFGDPKHVRSRLWYEPGQQSAGVEVLNKGIPNLPFNVDAFITEKAQQSMPHQSHTTTLGSGAEEHDPELPVLNRLDVFLRSAPCRLADRALVVFRRCQANLTGPIDLNLVAVVDSDAWLLGRPVNTGRTMSALREWETRTICLREAFSRHRVCKFVHIFGRSILAENSSDFEHNGHNVKLRPQSRT